MTRLAVTALPFLLSSVALADCLSIAADRILGSDLAKADAHFAALPASLVIAWAPPLGAQRTFPTEELRRIAKAHGIPAFEPRAGLCFEVPHRKIESEEALSAMRGLLPDADIAVLELSQSPVPPGKLEFPLSTLEPAPLSKPGNRLWRGYVLWSESRREPVWARVRISQTLLAVVALKDLPANKPIDEAALRLEKRSVFSQNLVSPNLVSQTRAIRLEDVKGRVPKRAIRAGEPILLSLLESPPDIHRGEVIRVEVRSGNTRLHFTAIAERDARSGETLDLRNTTTGKTFRAKLDGSKAVVVVGGVL